MKILLLSAILAATAAATIYIPNGQVVKVYKRPRARRHHTYRYVYQPQLVPVAVGVPALNLAGMQTMHLSRKEGRKMWSQDFTFLSSPLLNSDSGQLNVAFTIQENVSWIYSQVATQSKGIRGYLPTRVAPTKGQCWSKLLPTGWSNMCDSIRETMNAGNGVQFTTNMFINHQPHTWKDGLAGSIAAGRSSGFFSNFILTPDAGKMLAIINPPHVMPKLCREGRGLYSWLTGKAGMWQVQGRFGVAGNFGATSDIVLATTGYTEILPAEFEKFRAVMLTMGNVLNHTSGRRGYDVHDCRTKDSWPSLRVEIGEFVADIHPGDYVMVTNEASRDFACHLDIVPSQNGQARLGPAFMRKVVSHFATDRVGFCHGI